MVEETQSFRTWDALLAGEDAERALAAVDAIAAALARLPRPGSAEAGAAQYGATSIPSFAGGHAGYALFFAYLHRHRPDEGFDEQALAHLELAIQLLSSAQTLPNLYSGFTGVAWTVEHLKDLLDLDQDDDDLNADVDQALYEHLGQSPWQRPYDLISGLAGYGVYALKRLPRPLAVKCLERVVDRLAELALERPEGVAWHTPADHLWPETRKDFPEGYYNLGVAHGVPGVVAVLAQICASGVARAKARPLLEGAVSWILGQRLAPGSDSAFPIQISGNGAVKNARAAWCYGDPGIAGALLVAARAIGEPTWESEAIELARRSAARPPSAAKVVDACLCHGAAGLGHLLNRCYQATGEEALRDQARFWLREALNLRRPGQGFAGYVTWELGAAGEMEWLPVPGFLTGAAGVGLALLAAVTSHDPRWDEVLLVSPVCAQTHRHESNEALAALLPGGSREEEAQEAPTQQGNAA